MINLMVVGNSKSGKTSLMKRLSKLRKLELPKDEINICEWKFSPPHNKYTICFRTWDFPYQVCKLAI